MYLNWALGLRELGCDVIWLEQADASSAGELGRQFELLRRELAPYGLSDRIALHGSEGQLPDGALPVEALEQAELLVNMAYEEPGSLPIHFRRSVLIDIDPGMTQLWGSTGELALGPHDAYFTVGEGIADGSARVDRLGVKWIHTPPCVSLDHWRAGGPSDGPYTTVTNWWPVEGEGGCPDRRGTLTAILGLTVRR